MPHRVKTPYTAAHLDTPEAIGASNLDEVLLWLDQHLNDWEWGPRGVRKDARPPLDAECHDLVFDTAPHAARFKLHWAGKMWAGE
jgi:hypothetical protein